tara:strand:- start:1484 stop:2227 length:744 start_codon:yes stop_codon:yes gene_type:complete
MFKKYSIWIGLPAFNEEKAIKKVLESLIKLEKKIKTNIRVIIYNDGSSDKTVNNAKIYRNKINLKIIDNKINKGLGEAIYSLILYFKKKSKINDKLILMDCDNTHDTNDILKMEKKANNKKNLLIIASRYQKGSKVKNVPFLRLLLSYLAFLVLNILYKTKGIKDFTSGYRFYDKFAINNFFRKIEKKYVPKQGFEMQLEIILKLRKSNVNFYEIPINLDYKKKPTDSKMKIFKTILSYLKIFFTKN